MENNIDLLTQNIMPETLPLQKPIDVVRSFTDIPAFSPQKNIDPNIQEILSQPDTLDKVKANYKAPMFEKVTRDIDEKYDVIFGKLKPKYNAYIQGVDNAEYWAQRQSWGDKVVNGLSKMVLKTGTNIVGGTIDVVASSLNSALNGFTREAFQHNKFGDFLDDVNKSLDNTLPNRLTKEYQNRNIAQKFFKADFWAGEVGDAVAFMAGAIGSELVWGTVTGGSSLALAGARWSARMAKGAANVGAKLGAGAVTRGLNGTAGVATKKMLKEYARTVANTSKVGAVANNARFMFTSSAFEAKVEGRAAFDENIEGFQHLMLEKEGRLPTFEEYQEFIPEAIAASDAVFRNNQVILALSNTAQFGRLLGVKKIFNLTDKAGSVINKRIFGKGITTAADGTKSLYKSNKLQRTIGKTYDWFKNPIVEGWEEGSQGVSNRFHSGILMSKYDPDSVYTNMSTSKAFMESLYDSFLTKEGFNEVGMGMIVGKLGGVFRGGFKGLVEEVRPGVEYNKEIKQLESYIEGHNKARLGLDKATRESLKKFALLNQQVNAVSMGNRALSEGQITEATVGFDAAAFFKMHSDNSQDMLGEGYEDFKKQLELMDNKEFAEDFDISEQDVQSYKESLVGLYESQMKDYSDSIAYAKANEASFKLKGLKKQHYEEEVAFNFFMGLQGLRQIDALGLTIEGELGENGIADQVAYFNNLSAQNKKTARDLNYNKKREKGLEEEYAALQMEYSLLLDQSKRVEENTALIKKIESNRIKAQKVLDEKTELQKKIQEEKDAINKSPKKTGFTFGSIFRNETGIENEQTATDSVEALDKLDDFLERLKKEDTQRYEAIQNLLIDYKSVIKNLEEFEKSLKLFEDPRNSAEKYKGIMKIGNKWLTRKKEEGNERTAAIDDLIEKTDNIDDYEAFFIHTMNEMMETVENYEAMPDTVKETVNIEEVVGNEDYKNFVDNGVVSEDIINTIADKVENGIPLTTREKIIHSTKEEEVKSAVKEIKKQKGDSLRKAKKAANKITPLEGKSQIETIRQLIQDIIGKKQSYLKDRAVSQVDSFKKEDIPTEEEFKRYNTLKKRSEKKPLSPKLQEEFDTLQEKIAKSGSIEGTGMAGFSLDELYAQLFELEELQNKDASENRPEGAEQHDTQPDDEISRSTETKAAYDVLQTYDKATISRTKDSVLLHNVSIKGLIELLNKTLEVTGVKIAKKEVAEIPSADTIVGKEVEISYTKEDGTEGKIGFKMGERGRLIFTNETAETIEEETVIRFGVNHNGKPMSAYTVAFMEAEGESHPMPSILDNEDTPPNVQAIQETEVGEEVEAFVNLEDAYNVDLVKKLKAKKITFEQFTQKLKIEYRRADGVVLGVIKADYNSGQNNQAYKRMQEVREEVAKKAFSNLEASEIQTGVRDRVKHVYIGHPAITVKDGQVVLHEVAEKHSDKIVDVGYVQDGKVVLRKGAEGVSNSFINRIIKDKNKTYAGQRVPIVVLDFAGKKIAYPVTQKHTTNPNAVDELVGIYNSDKPLKDKVLEIYNLLAENNIDPNTVDLRTDNISDTKIQEIAQKLDNNKIYAPIQELTSGKTKTSEIAIEHFMLNIDLGGNMFYSPKVVLDYVKEENKKADEVIEEEELDGDNIIENEKDTKDDVQPTIEEESTSEEDVVETPTTSNQADIKAKKADIERRLGIKLPVKNTSLPVSSKTWGDRKSLANQLSSELKGVVERGISMQEWLDKGYGRQLATWTDETIIEFLEVADIEAKKAEIEKLKKDKQEELKNSEINFEPLTTTVDGSWDKAKPINNELKNRFENSLQEGDKIITGNNEIIFFKNGKVVKRDGKDYGMSDIPTTAILTKGAKIDKTDSINAKYDAEIAQKQAELKALEQQETITPTTQSTSTTQSEIEVETKEVEELSKEEAVKEIQSKNLTHVRGLGMSAQQASGTYISTEGQNRYATEENRAERVFVNITSPLVVSNDTGLVSKRNEILNQQKSKFSAEDSFTYEEFGNKKLTVDDLNEQGLEKLAILVTESLIEEGYDSIYFPETSTQEGELVVFYRENIQFEDDYNQEEAELLEGGAKKRREAGYFDSNGIRYERQVEDNDSPKGNKGSVKFADKLSVPYTYELREDKKVQPSHKNGALNNLHFIPEAQPKDRRTKDSVIQIKQIADNPNLLEAGESPIAYSGAPIINKRGEVIQGNNRAQGIVKHYAEQGKQYKQQLTENAEKFGFTKEQVEAMENPVLVRVVNATDADAIKLGNYDSADIESAGSGRLDIDKLDKRIATEDKSRLLDAVFKDSDTDTINSSIRTNINKIYQILEPYLNLSQKNSIFGKSSVSQETINDLEKLFQKFLFINTSTLFDTAFGNLPTNVQKGIHKSAALLLRVPKNKSIIKDLQNAIIANYNFSKSGVDNVVEWLNQGSLFGEKAPRDKYTPLEIELFKIIQDTSRIEDMSKPLMDYARATASTPRTLFEEAKEGLSREEAVKKVFNVDYTKPIALETEDSSTKENNNITKKQTKNSPEVKIESNGENTKNTKIKSEQEEGREKPIFTEFGANLTPKFSDSISNRDKEKLTPHQVKGANAIINAVKKSFKGFLLADGAGAGKTRQLLVAAKELSKQGKRVLIVTENKEIISGSFRKDSEDLGLNFSQDKSGEAVVEGVEITTVNRYQKDVINENYDVVIFDESQKASGFSQTGDKLKSFRGQVIFSSATPFDTVDKTLYIIPRLLNISQEEYLTRIGARIAPKSGGGLEVVFNNKDKTKFYNLLNSLHNNLISQGKMLHRRYEFFGVDNLNFEVTGEDFVSGKYDVNTAEDGINNHYSQLARKARLTSEDVRKGFTIEDKRRKINESKVNELKRLAETYKATQELANEIKEKITKGEQVVLYGTNVSDTITFNYNGVEDVEFGDSSESEKYTRPSFISQMKKLLSKEGIDFIEVIGTNTKRAKDVERFQNGQVKVALVNQAGTTGINLNDTVGNAPRTLYIAGSLPNAIQLEQLKGRVSRLNNASKAKVVYITANSNAESRDASKRNQKLAILNSLLEGQQVEYTNDNKQVVDVSETPTTINFTEEAIPDSFSTVNISDRAFAVKFTKGNDEQYNFLMSIGGKYIGKSRVMFPKSRRQKVLDAIGEKFSENIENTFTDGVVYKLEKPLTLYKGTRGKLNPDGTKRTAHPDVKGRWFAEDVEIAKNYSEKDSPLIESEIPIDTEIEVVRIIESKKEAGMSEIRRIETDRINNSKYGIVKLITRDASGKVEEQYVDRRHILAQETKASKNQATYTSYEGGEGTKVEKTGTITNVTYKENGNIDTVELLFENGETKTVKNYSENFSPYSLKFEKDALPLQESMESTQTTNELSDVESTAKALEDNGYEIQYQRPDYAELYKSTGNDNNLGEYETRKIGEKIAIKKNDDGSVSIYKEDMQANGGGLSSQAGKDKFFDLGKREEVKSVESLLSKEQTPNLGSAKISLPSNIKTEAKKEQDKKCD